MTPLVKMHTLGHDFIPEPIHAGGLRYHGMAPLVSACSRSTARSRRGASTSARRFEAGVQFARAEGILPAPEPTHAIKRRDRRGARGQGGGRAAGDPVQPVRPRPLRPGGLRALPRRQARGLRVPAREGRGRARRPAAGSDAANVLTAIAACPSSPAGRAAARSIRSSPLESLFAEERRCPRCGAYLDDGAARDRAPRRDPSPEPARRPGAARGTASGGIAERRAGADAARPTATAAGTPGLGRLSPAAPRLRYSGDADRLPRLRADRRFDRPRPPRGPGRRLDR